MSIESREAAAAAASASTGVVTIRSATQGMLKRANSCFAWASSSDPEGSVPTSTALPASDSSIGGTKLPTLNIAASAAVQLSAAEKAGTPWRVSKAPTSGA